MRRSLFAMKTLSPCGPQPRARKSRLSLESLERRDCPAPVLGLGVSQSVIFEGERAEVTLTLSQRLRTTERVTVTTQAITATYGVDYFAPLSQQVTFAPGQLSQKIFIPSLRDSPRSLVEGVEYFSVIATPASPGLGVRSATVGIADYAPPPTIRVTDIAVAEGNSGSKNAVFTVSLSATYPKAVSVNYATRDLTATVADTDYVAAAGTLTFLPGQTSRTVAVAVNGDTRLEPNERFQLLLSAPTNASLATATATCTINNDETDQPGFQITLTFRDGPRGPVPASVQNAATQAAARWSRIITGDLPSVTQGGLFIDDFNMVVQMGLLGGAPEAPGGVLANAMPTDFRDGGNGLPYAGITGIDPNDINYDPSFMIDVLAHEMGHAFGFTDGAGVFSRWITGDTFTGANALREFRAIFGSTATSVPLQAGVRAHWDETVFGNELMSPSIGGTPNPISRVTVGALADMGYTVSYAAAEPYTPPLTWIPPAVSRPTTAPTPAAASPPGGGVRRGSVGTGLSRPSTRALIAAMAVESLPESSWRNDTTLSPKLIATPPDAGKNSSLFRSLGSLS
jgi:hypothetical protein